MEKSKTQMISIARPRAQSDFGFFSSNEATHSPREKGASSPRIPISSSFILETETINKIAYSYQKNTPSPIAMRMIYEERQHQTLIDILKEFQHPVTETAEFEIILDQRRAMIEMIKSGQHEGLRSPENFLNDVEGSIQESSKDCSHELIFDLEINPSR
jgi:hypothetical protein